MADFSRKIKASNSSRMAITLTVFCALQISTRNAMSNPASLTTSETSLQEPQTSLMSTKTSPTRREMVIMPPSSFNLPTMRRTMYSTLRSRKMWPSCVNWYLGYFLPWQKRTFVAEGVHSWCLLWRSRRISKITSTYHGKHILTKHRNRWNLVVSGLPSSWWSSR